MNFKSKRINTILTWLLVVVISQVIVSAGLAEPLSGVPPSSAVVQQISGILATSANKPVSVNGQSAITGVTILSGATIETPDGVKATVAIPGHGTVEADSNTLFTITFDQTGIKVNLIRGCLVLVNMKGTTGEIDNPQGVVGKRDGLSDGRLDTCPTKAPVVAAAGAGGAFGIGTAATVILFGGIVATAVTVPIILHGGKASPSAP